MTLEKLKEHCKKQMGMYGGNVSTNVYLEHSMVLNLINEHENRARHDSELLDKFVARLKDYFVIPHDVYVIERMANELKAEVTENV